MRRPLQSHLGTRSSCVRIDKIYWWVIRFITVAGLAIVILDGDKKSVRSRQHGFIQLIPNCFLGVLSPSVQNERKGRVEFITATPSWISVWHKARREQRWVAPFFQPSCYNLAPFSSLSFFLHLKEKTPSIKKTQTYALDSSFCILNSWFMFL